MARIDVHQHFWRLEWGDYGWLTPEIRPIYRDFAPGDLEPLLAAAWIDGTVLIQAAPTEAETGFTPGLADEASFIKGVVGWVEASKRLLEELSDGDRAAVWGGNAAKAYHLRT